MPTSGPVCSVSRVFRRASSCWHDRRSPAPRPARGPGLERCERTEKIAAGDAEAVAAVGIDLHEAALPQLGQALVEHARRHGVAAGAQRAEGERLIPQLPQHPQRPPAPEEIERGHDRPTRARAADRPSGSWGRHLALRFQKRYGFRSHERRHRMTEPKLQPRIAPLEAPFAPEIDASLRAMMPRNSPIPSLTLFRVLVRAPRLADAMTALGRFLLGRDCALDLHDRELVIDRVCARCACEYEWGVHVTVYGARAGFSPAQLEATVRGDAGTPVWSERE